MTQITATTPAPTAEQIEAAAIKFMSALQNLAEATPRPTAGTMDEFRPLI